MFNLFKIVAAVLMSFALVGCAPAEVDNSFYTGTIEPATEPAPAEEGFVNFSSLDQTDQAKVMQLESVAAYVRDSSDNVPSVVGEPVDASTYFGEVARGVKLEAHSTNGNSSFLLHYGDANSVVYESSSNVVTLEGAVVLNR